MVCGYYVFGVVCGYLVFWRVGIRYLGGVWGYFVFGVVCGY